MSGLVIRKRQSNPMSVRDWPVRFAPYLLLAILAGISRLISLDLVSWTGDEGVHATFAKFAGDWPMVGLVSVGIRNSAVFIHLLSTIYMMPGLRDSLSGAAFIAGCNVLLLLLVFRFLRQHAGILLAWLIALWFAFAPWQIMFARNMWPPSLISLLGFLLLNLALNWQRDLHSKQLVASSALAIVLPQMHFSGAAATIWFQFFMLVQVIKGPKRSQIIGLWFVGTVIGLASWSSWIYYNHVALRWQDIPPLRSLLETGKLPDASQIKFEAGEKQSYVGTAQQAGEYFLQEAHFGGFDFWFGRSMPVFQEQFPAWSWQAFTLANYGLSVIIIFALLLGLWQGGLARWSALFALMPIIMLTVLRPKVFPQYLIVAYPAVFVVVGSVFHQIVLRFGRPAVIAGVVAAGFVLALQLLFISRLYLYLDSGQHIGGHFELSYRQRLEVAREIIKRYPKGVLSDLAGAFSGFHPAYDHLHKTEMERQNLRVAPSPDRAQFIIWVDESPLEQSDEPGRKLIAQYRGLANLKLVERFTVRFSRVLVYQIER